MRALFLSGLIVVAGPCLAETQTSALRAIEGLWGFEIVPDMTCAANPVQIEVSDDEKQMIFSWPKAVQYSDGTSSDGVTFTIVQADGLALDLRRDRDGVLARIEVARNGLSFQYTEADPNGGSRFDRCAGLSS